MQTLVFAVSADVAVAAAGEMLKLVAPADQAVAAEGPAAVAEKEAAEKAAAVVQVVAVAEKVAAAVLEVARFVLLMSVGLAAAPALAVVAPVVPEKGR